MRKSWKGALAVVLCGLAGVAAAATGAGSGEPLERNKALVRRVFDEILVRGKFELFEQIYARDFAKHVNGQTFDLAQETEQARATRAMFSDLAITVDQLIAEGDRVAVVYTGRGTMVGDFLGVPATGKVGVVTGATVFRLSAGQIAEEWTFYDSLEILRQMGYRPGPPVPVAP